MPSLIHSVYFSDNIEKTSTHHHDCHQILFITKCIAEISVNNETHIAKSGDIIILSRYENHSVNILSAEYERYILRVRPQGYGDYNKIYSLLFNRPQGFNNLIDVSGNINGFKALFDLIIEEYNSKDSLFEEMLHSLVNKLLIMLYRSLPKNDNYFDNQGFELILKLQKEFEENYGLYYSLEDLAKQYNISVSSLSHQFKKITGMSVMDYLLSCRIASAKNFLAKTNLSISEIVELCGFSDNSNFSRTFKKLNGMTPTEFRKKEKS